MIRLVEALNYRCLRYIRQPLDSFHVLVGPNASGKTTFLDVVAFLGKLVSDGLDSAIEARTQNFEDLVFARRGDKFELAIEAAIPEERKTMLKRLFENVRYEVVIGYDRATNEVAIQAEKVWLKPRTEPNVDLPGGLVSLFPAEPELPESIVTGSARSGWQSVLTKSHQGNANFYVEVRAPGGGKGWFPSIRLGPRKSALVNLPEDETKFPVSTWLKDQLATSVQSFVLNSLLIRLASPHTKTKNFRPDGSNLPWVIAGLEGDPERYAKWIAHIQTALPDIEGIRTVERPDDRHRYMMIRYRGGLEIPSWVASDGTLRLLALTLPAYLPQFKGVYLIEEPENGIHPVAVEAAYQSLSSVYEAQILLASHSPVILSLADADKVLCFKKTDSGATDIVRGSDHPRLRDWKGETNLGVLFAGGVLG